MLILSTIRSVAGGIIQRGVKMVPTFLLIIYLASIAESNPSVNINFQYPNVKDEIYEQPVDMMTPVRTPHSKDKLPEPKQNTLPNGAWAPYDFDQFDEYLNKHENIENNRIKRRAKRRRGGRRRNRVQKGTTTAHPEELKNTTNVVDGRRKSKKRKKEDSSKYETYEPQEKEYESSFVEMPKDLYQAHLRPGVIFRIHMSEAILKMQYRNYGEDKDESVIEADVEYLRLTRKVINDEITKFEDLKWLMGWFNNRSELIQEHMCNTRYYATGTPPTLFTHTEEYMKRMCLFDNVYLDHIPYVVGEDGSLMGAVAPPVLHCDASTCTSVPFIDSLMFDEKLSRTNVRTLTRCQASCRAHCRNNPDCLKRCSDRCLRAD